MLVPAVQQVNQPHIYIQFSSVQFSRSVVSDSLQPHKSLHARAPCQSSSPGVHSDSRASSQWCHPAISSSVVPFSSCPQLPGASVRNSAHGKGHEEGGLAYAGLDRASGVPLEILEHLPPKPESAYFTALCSHLHLWLYGGGGGCPPPPSLSLKKS